jgi:predicted phosphoadenosine phosphosulfate sulfurtransferase
LQELEPETYNQLEKRLKGVHTAAIYKENNALNLARSFNTWKEYKEFY